MMRSESLHLVGSEIRRHPGVKRKSLLGQIVLVMLGVQVALFGSFTCFDLPTGTGSNLVKYAHRETRNLVLMTPAQVQDKVRQYAPAIFDEPQSVRYSTYVPLAPTAILIGYVLGPRLALWSIGLFLGLGIAGPLLGIYPLASGGGVNYYLEPGFGYLLGMFGGAGMCGWITNKRRTSLTQIVGVAAGIIAIHAAGCAYLICSYLYFYVFEGSKAYLEWQPWIFQYMRNLSWYALPYDAVLALAAVGIAFPFRWLVNTLTITDAAPTPKKVKYDRRALEELAR
ncbi:biotin transporter BioY [Candidatus Obscuribacterales bacterium]|nr:biotin transporter BioY [Candidatus Obscuribacterales bacterium]MBX3134909.1 biotin transporter BioY [Candidatus Obscuribacterales bacterium]MBX3150657.1 biotin transporter BioY [Candidatus Obscuribacterales bacterium]